MITRNFSRDEFACGCGCGLAEPHPALVIGLQRLRDVLREPVHVLSGSRCAAHNARVGGSRGSFHLAHPTLGGYTCAADISTGAPLVEAFNVAESLEYFGGGGIGVYGGPRPWIHVDVRGATGQYGPSRWAKVNGVSVGVEDALREVEP